MAHVRPHALVRHRATSGGDGIFEERQRTTSCASMVASSGFRCATGSRLPGRHNLQNAMAAACAAVAGRGRPRRRPPRPGIVSPLPHRLEFVGTVAAGRFYNDSLATTPESAVVALDAFSEPIVLLVGGYDKQIDLTPLAEAVARKVKAAALMGQTADALGLPPRIARRRRRACRCRNATRFEEAFRWAVEPVGAGGRGAPFARLCQLRLVPQLRRAGPAVCRIGRSAWQPRDGAKADRPSSSLIYWSFSSLARHGRRSSQLAVSALEVSRRHSCGVQIHETAIVASGCRVPRSCGVRSPRPLPHRSTARSSPTASKSTTSPRARGSRSC